ncbi:MAG: SDR family oxidoreductase [Clostridiales bacterium]|nr:SDR family oxidoreductase [Clostridiales bacterium]
MKALVTGASSGIGRETAKYLALLNYDLIIVARNTDKLYKLRDEIKNVNVRVITLDLSREQDCYDLYEHTKDENIDFLVNNAGFGAYGKFLDVQLETEVELMHTNMVAVHILTKLYLQDMAKRNSGYILNVASLAGFSAGPTFSSYYASKNYVLRLTEAIHEELRRDNINVGISALCPGPVKTNFNDVANVKFCVDGLTPEYVAKYAVDKTFKNKMVIIPGFSMKVTKLLEHFGSEKLVTRVAYRIQSRKSGTQ